MSKSKIQFGGQFKTKSNKATVVYASDKPNIQEDSYTELNEMQKQFKEKAKYEASLKDANTQTEFWSCIIFKTQEQRDSFCSLLGLKFTDNQYINGQALIKALELNIAKVNLKQPGKFQCNKEIANLAMEI